MPQRQFILLVLLILICKIWHFFEQYAVFDRLCAKKLQPINIYEMERLVSLKRIRLAILLCIVVFLLAFNSILLISKMKMCSTNSEYEQRRKTRQAMNHPIVVQDNIETKAYKAKEHITREKTKFEGGELSNELIEKHTYMDCSSLFQQGSPDMTITIFPEILPEWAKKLKEQLQNNEIDKQFLLEKKETDKERKESFSKIWNSSIWNFDQKSGQGSTIRSVRKSSWFLEQFIERYRSSEKYSSSDPVVLFDVPCGDFVWISKWVLEASLSEIYPFEYYGFDIVNEAIISHQKKYEGNKRINFEELDVVSSPLKVQGKSPDLVFCRHMLQHLTNEEGLKAVENIQKSGAKYLITTTYPDWSVPIDLSGLENDKEFGNVGSRMRKLNLEIEPFNFPKPICIMHDFSSSFLGIWKLPLEGRDN